LDFLSLRLAPVLVAPMAAPLGAAGASIDPETLFLSGRHGGAPVARDFRCSAGQSCGAWDARIDGDRGSGDV
jgi:hypothetical protein